MKKPTSFYAIQTLCILILFAIFASEANAQFGAFDSLNANNISCRINNIGDNFDDFSNGVTHGFTAPKNTNKSTIYASALWIGGYQNNHLKIAAMTYRQSGIDFFPGPLDTTTPTITDSEKATWNHVWKVDRSEINDFRANHTIYSSIANWPGNATLNTKEARIQAPYVDVDHDGKYNPIKGDYPEMVGDEMLWWVFNDIGGNHGETGGYPMGIEINAKAYEFNSAVDAINNTVFLDYKITNRSDTDIVNAYIGLWTDFDIGYAFDDYVGSAPTLSAYYGYNGKPVDAVYGTNTPVQSVIFLKDSMSRFMYYNNDASTVNGNPGFPNKSPSDYYNYIAGVWKNKACMKYGQDGVKGTQCTDYMFDGDPSDTLSGWTEHNVGNIPGDRRGLGSIGPFTIKAKSTFDFPFAYVFAQKPNGNTASNFQLLEGYWTQVKNYYNSNYTSAIEDVSDPDAAAYKLFPNPAGNVLNIASANPLMKKIVIIDNTGRVVYNGNNLDGQKLIRIDISPFPEGVYTVITESKTGRAAAKLVISR